MADGEISVNVRAEGVDEAAEEVADGSGASMGGDDGGGGGRDSGLAQSIKGDGGDDGSDGGRGGGLAQSIKGGIVGGLVASLLGPLLDVFEPFLKILQAFVAPLAQLLLRLFTPVLRFLIQLLPAWFDFVDENEGLLSELLMSLFPIVALLSNLPSIVRFVSKLPGKIDSLPEDIKEFVNALPGKIGAAIGSRVPFLSASTTTEDPGPVTSGTSAEVEEQTAANGPISIAISGSLTPFIDLITANRNIDFED